MAFCSNKALVINTNPGCDSTMDPDMASSGSMGPDVTWPQVAVQATKI